MNCSYCENNNLIHVDSGDILSTLYSLDEDKRKIILQFIHKVKKDKFHSTVAENDLENAFCEFCGSNNEREEEDDRYLYLCSNNNCEVWK